MREALLEIDLNIPQIEIDNGSEQQETPLSLPDLNIEAPMIETHSVGHFLFDLNSDPCVEHDTRVEEESQTWIETDENINDEDANEELSRTPRNVKHLSNDERRDVYNVLLRQSIDGKLNYGVRKMVASQFSVSGRTISRIWKQSQNGTNGDISQNRVGNCGRKRIHVNIDQIREIPLHKRTTLRTLACSINMSHTTLYRRLKSRDIRRHSNAIKPFLKEENKRSRLQFCLSMLDGGSIPHDPIFTGMHNIIHIDEKWFYLTKKSEHYYLLPDEEDPIRTCKSKNFIGKVMFLVAVARPRFDSQGNETFSGKIGVFPLVTKEPARRNSVNRVAGTLETKPIASVKKDIIRSYLIEKVIPAIKEKWPRDDARYTIYIQQDNARTHIDHNDDEFCRAAMEGGFDIRLMCQPPNSPDLNVLDLGFFSAIQSLQHKISPKTIDELVDAVVQAFHIFSAKKSNHVFLTLQLCMIEIMRAKGSHSYKIPHINKARLEKDGQLPTQLKCDPELVQEVLCYLG